MGGQLLSFIECLRCLCPLLKHLKFMHTMFFNAIWKLLYDGESDILMYFIGKYLLKDATEEFQNLKPLHRKLLV